MAIRVKRQGGGASSTAEAKAPTSLKYGEPAVDSAGRMYVGDGKGGVASKVTEADNGLWLYTGTFTVDDWVESDGEGDPVYTQTQDVTPYEDNGPALTADMTLSTPKTSQTNVKETNEEKQDALGIIASGKATPGAGQVTIMCWEQPGCDLDIYWYAR